MKNITAIKVSEAIRALTEFQEKHGDLLLRWTDGDGYPFHVNEVSVEKATPYPVPYAEIRISAYSCCYDFDADGNLMEKADASSN